MSARIINADVFEGLAQLPDESVHCVVTSPPYWGLRDYGTGKWEGGDPNCDHLAPAAHGYAPFETPTLGPKRDGISAANSAHANGVKRQQFKGTCGKCGAVKGDRQIGQEPTLAEHIQVMVDVFREVRRVPRSDGTLWLNYGDAYNASLGQRKTTDKAGPKQQSRCDANFKPKDLMLMPSRIAIALQDDGWWVRSKIIWHKPNPMPESVTDRPTSSYEEILLLTKSGRYFYDAEAVKEPIADPSRAGKIAGGKGRKDAEYGNAHGDVHRGALGGLITETRNLRNVWTIATQPYKGAHFATFPQKLAETCIKAGCPEGGTVLDPFGGSGTTGIVADRIGRNAILIELSAKYSRAAEARIKSDAPLFADVFA